MHKKIKNKLTLTGIFSIFIITFQTRTVWNRTTPILFDNTFTTVIIRTNTFLTIIFTFYINNIV